MRASINRRALLAGAAAVVAVAGQATAAQADPIFAAIARWEAANAKFGATLDKLSAAETAVLDLGFGFAGKVAKPDVPDGEFSSHRQISYYFDYARLSERGCRVGVTTPPPCTAALDEAEAAAHAELDRQLGLIEAEKQKHDVAGLKLLEDEHSDDALTAENAALATVPTTLGGCIALAEFMSRHPIDQNDDLAMGAKSLATALRNLGALS